MKKTKLKLKGLAVPHLSKRVVRPPIGGRVEDQKFAKNKAELARILDISRVTLDAWLKLQESPRALSNGRFVIAEWRNFSASRRIDRGAEETAELKLKKLRDEVARGEVELMKQAGDLVPVEWSKQLFAHLAISVRTIIQGSSLANSDKIELTKKIEAIDCEDYLSQLRSQTFDIVAEEPESNFQNGASEG